MRRSILLAVFCLFGSWPAAGGATPPVAVTDLNVVFGAPMHWFYYIVMLEDAQRHRYYFGCCCGSDHSCTLVLKRLDANESRQPFLEGRFHQRSSTVSAKHIELTFGQEGAPQATLRLILSTASHQFIYTRDAQRLNLRVQSLGHPFWWHDKRRPPPGAQLLDKYYGVDDISAFRGVLRSEQGGRADLHGTGVYEMMYIDDPRTNRAWTHQNWLAFASPAAFGLVLDFDNYFDGYVYLLPTGQFVRLHSATFTLGSLDGTGYPQEVAAEIQTAAGVLRLQGHRFYKDSVYRIPILVGDKVFQDLHFDLQGRFSFADGGSLDLGLGYAVDQVLVPADPSVPLEQYLIRLQ